MEKGKPAMCLAYTFTALKPIFCQNYFQVTFVGEDGSDGGGLTREFFTLVGRHLEKYIESTGCFKHNSLALQVHIIYGIKVLIMHVCFCPIF